MSPLSLKLLNHSLWRTLEKVRKTVEWSHSQLADHLGLTLREYHKFRVTGHPLSVTAIFNLANELGLNAEQLCFGQVDFETLLKHYVRADLAAVPERYSQGAFSRRRTSLHMVDFCDAHFGEDFT